MCQTWPSRFISLLCSFTLVMEQMKIQVQISWVGQSTRHDPFRKITLKCCDIKCCLGQKIAGVQQEQALSDQASDFSTLSKKLYLRTIINAIEWEGVWNPNRGINLLRERGKEKLAELGASPIPVPFAKFQMQNWYFLKKFSFIEKKISK